MSLPVESAALKEMLKYAGSIRGSGNRRHRPTPERFFMAALDVMTEVFTVPCTIEERESIDFFFLRSPWRRRRFDLLELRLALMSYVDYEEDVEHDHRRMDIALLLARIYAIDHDLDFITPDIVLKAILGDPGPYISLFYDQTNLEIDLRVRESTDDGNVSGETEAPDPDGLDLPDGFDPDDVDDMDGTDDPDGDDADDEGFDWDVPPSKFWEFDEFDVGEDGGDNVEEEEEEEDEESGSRGALITAEDLFTGRGEGLGKMKDLEQRCKQLYRILTEKIIGQDAAVEALVSALFRAITRSALGTEDGKGRPRAVLLFAGPPGVGKTFLAENFADLLSMPFKRFDMSDYCEKESSSDFAGNNAVYNGAAPGIVTSFVYENPVSVLLFDEIEKAHSVVVNQFLQILDDGRLLDRNMKEEVSFSDTIIIITTNAGRQLYEDSDIADLSAVPGKVVINALLKDVDPFTHNPSFPPPIVSRLACGDVIMFDRIRPSGLMRILKQRFSERAEEFGNELGIRFTADEDVFTALLNAEGAYADGRGMHAKADGSLFRELKAVIEHLVNTDKADGIKNVRIRVDIPREENEIRSLFVGGEGRPALVYAPEEILDKCRRSAPSAAFIPADCGSSVKELLLKHDVAFALVDLACTKDQRKDRFSILDVPSDAARFLRSLREDHPELPVYLLDRTGRDFSDDETAAYRRRGVRGTVKLGRGGKGFAEAIRAISSELYREQQTEKLNASNRVLAYDVSHTVDRRSRSVHITLYDLRLRTAVDAEDSEDVVERRSIPEVKFIDVIGAEDAKRELYCFADYLKDPKRYIMLGIAPPKGILLYGEPGTGKTMLAKAMANAAGATFIAVEGNRFIGRYAGTGSETIHAVFRKARKYAPTVLFIDEIDTIAKARTGESNATAAEDALTALLTEMDGFRSYDTKPVFVLAATNYSVFDDTDAKKKQLDSAFLRRFDRRIRVELPDRSRREQYLRGRTGSSPAFAVSEKEIVSIASRSTGMSLADLSSVAELALRAMTMSGKTEIDDSALDEAFETFRSGEHKGMTDAEKLRIARHEAGHAFLAWESGNCPSYVTIVSRGEHGGYVQTDPGEGRMLRTRKELLAMVRAALGGRAAETVYYGYEDGLSAGVESDLSAATRIARAMVCRLGMDDNLGLCVIENGEMTKVVHSAVNAILRRELDDAVAAIEANRDLVDRMVDCLLEKNYVTEAAIASLWRPEDVKRPKRRAAGGD